jgi:mycothiol synthase
MKILELSNARIAEFADYCRRHRQDVDESFIYDEDLEEFQVDKDNPTYIVTDIDGRITAAASLIADEYNRRGKKGRFRIFHSEIDDAVIYGNLLESILKHADGLEKVNIFVPLHNKGLVDNIARLGFEIERYVFLMARELNDVPHYRLPMDYSIRPLDIDHDAENWCLVRNTAFASVKGNETPITPQMVKDMTLSKDYIEGGCMMLYHKDSAVGCVRCSLDDHENETVVNIGPLAVLPEYQGKGLGRILLRAGIEFAKNKAFNKAILCVNTDNERAKSLYIQEGFKQVEAIVCYCLML